MSALRNYWILRHRCHASDGDSGAEFPGSSSGRHRDCPPGDAGGTRKEYLDVPRKDGRRRDELRPVKMTRGFMGYAEGSVLIEMGRTRVLCAATVEERVPNFLRGTGQGWVTGEYGMLPRSTDQRSPRDAGRLRPSGRNLDRRRRKGANLDR